MKNNRFYIKSPKLPCIVYSGLTVIQQVFIILPVFFLLLYLSDYGLSLKIFLSAFLIGVCGLLIRQDHNIRKVYLTDKVAEISLGFGKKKQIDLADYYILVDRINIRAPIRDHYSYQVFLMPKKIAEPVLKDGNVIHMGWHIKRTDYVDAQHSDKETKFVGKVDAIPLSSRIFTPENLKEYIEAIQLQSKPVLHVIFASEQLKQDYDLSRYNA